MLILQKDKTGRTCLASVVSKGYYCLAAVLLGRAQNDGRMTRSPVILTLQRGAGRTPHLPPSHSDDELLKEFRGQPEPQQCSIIPSLAHHPLFLETSLHVTSPSGGGGKTSPGSPVINTLMLIRHLVVWPRSLHGFRCLLHRWPTGGGPSFQAEGHSCCRTFSAGSPNPSTGTPV